MSLDEMRRLERTMEEMGLDIDTIITVIAVAQREIMPLSGGNKVKN